MFPVLLNAMWTAVAALALASTVASAASAASASDGGGRYGHFSEADHSLLLPRAVSAGGGGGHYGTSQGKKHHRNKNIARGLFSDPSLILSFSLSTRSRTDTGRNRKRGDKIKVMAEGGREEGGCPEGREVGHKLCMQPTPLLSFSFRFLPPAPPFFHSGLLDCERRQRKNILCEPGFVKESLLSDNLFSRAQEYTYTNTHKRILQGPLIPAARSPRENRGRRKTFLHFGCLLPEYLCHIYEADWREREKKKVKLPADVSCTITVCS